jgi:hypothetical protein
MSVCAVLITGTLTFETHGEIILWIRPFSRELALFLVHLLRVDGAHSNPGDGTPHETRGNV